MTISSTLFLLGHLLVAAPNHATAASVPQVARAMAPAVAGKVLTEYGEPLPGVVVAVQGTPQATSTNAAGDFLLPLTELKTVLLFKCQGYRDQTLAVSAGNSLTVKMYALTSTRPVPAGGGISAADAGASEAGATGKPEVLKFSEELPTFPGGDAAYQAYMRQNAKFPEEAQVKRASAMVFVSFVVDEQGRIVDAEVVRGGGFGFDQEALRLIRLMPWWNPGRQAGKAVRVARVLPVPFVFREQEQ